MDTQTPMLSFDRPESDKDRHFRSKGFNFWSFFFTGLTGVATFLILAILAVILGNIVINGGASMTWRFITSG
ncbi:MAG TPA: hypothetical protein VK968_16630, partial [Roseimicrobium sp.]|nr:hypothetical protein [Roseimicrobium sp.]